MQPHAPIHAIQAEFLHVNVTDPHGKNVVFTPWFGALAHAIFFRKGSLDYFHTHICAPNAPNCGSLPGVPATRITGSSTAPGKLTVGVLLAAPGNVAAVPADEAGRPHHHRPLHAPRGLA